MQVTKSQLAAAFEGFVLGARPVDWDGSGDPVTVQVADADALAEALFATLSRMAALREPGGDAGFARSPACADPEVSAIIALIAALAPLPAHPGEPHGPVWRALRLVAERHGYVLCTED